jgi:hypothetical protein
MTQNKSESTNTATAELDELIADIRTNGTQAVESISRLYQLASGHSWTIVEFASEIDRNNILRRNIGDLTGWVDELQTLTGVPNSTVGLVAHFGSACEYAKRGSGDLSTFEARLEELRGQFEETGHAMAGRLFTMAVLLGHCRACRHRSGRSARLLASRIRFLAETQRS